MQRSENDGLRPTLKRAAETLLVRAGIPRLTRLRLRDRTLVLAYHNVVPVDENGPGDTSLHLALPQFTRQLDILAETHDVVSLDQTDLGHRPSAVPSSRAGRRGRARAVITFDDAYLGAVKLAVPELVRRDLPATIFVAPALLGGLATWWDRLGPTLRTDDQGRIRARALRECSGDEASVLEMGAREEWPLVEPGPWSRIAHEEHLAAASRQPGITLAAHGWRHLNLTAVSDAVLRTELERPLLWLRERFATCVPWLAYPYGLASSRVRSAAKEAGYVGAVQAGGGWVTATGTDPYAVPRLNIPAGLSSDGFRLRMAGLFGGGG